MKADKVSFYEWQKKFSTDSQCMTHLEKLRWPDGFQCPHCGHDKGYKTVARNHYSDIFMPYLAGCAGQVDGLVQLL